MDYRDYIDKYVDDFMLTRDPFKDSLGAAKYAVEFIEKTRKDNIFLRLTTGGPMYPPGTQGAAKLRRLGVYTVAIAGCCTTQPLDTFTLVYEQVTHADEIPWLKEKKYDILSVCDALDPVFAPRVSEAGKKYAEDLFLKWENLYKEYLLNE